MAFWQTLTSYCRLQHLRDRGGCPRHHHSKYFDDDDDDDEDEIE